MKIVEQYPFHFADADFEIYWTDQRILILPMRQLCDALGLNLPGQLERIKRDVVLAKQLYMVRVWLRGQMAFPPNKRLPALATGDLIIGWVRSIICV